MLDLERLLAKVTLGTATPSDMLALGRSLAAIAGGRKARCRTASPTTATAKLTCSRTAAIEFSQAIAEEPPVNLADGGTIRDGFHRGAG